MAKFREKGGLFGLLLLLLLFGLVAASSEVAAAGGENGGLEGPKTAAVSSASAAAVAGPRPPRPRPSSSGPSSSLKMHLTANPRTKDHRNGKSEYIPRSSLVQKFRYVVIRTCVGLTVVNVIALVF